MLGMINIKKEALVLLCGKIMKRVRALTSGEAGANKKPTSNLKMKEYICFMIKAVEEGMRRTGDVGALIMDMKDKLFEVVCTAAECEDIMIRN